MTIYRAQDFIDVYRAKANAGPINELTGRSGRPELTAFVIRQIIENIHLRRDSIVVDIGCGDGSLLQLAARTGVDGSHGRLIGVLPTDEEISRVREHLLKTKQTLGELISIERGLFERTKLPDNFADVVISNSTLLLLKDQAHLDAALAEIARIAKPETAEIFIGELPERDESAGLMYGTSITVWLWSVWLQLGFAHFRACLRQVLRAALSRQPFVLAPRKVFYMEPEAFIGRLQRFGLRVDRHFRHRELDARGNPCESATRWDYVLRRVS
jgi:ubiquinone/menaquinone biosynthesis C-methylase UbiE